MLRLAALRTSDTSFVARSARALTTPYVEYTSIRYPEPLPEPSGLSHTWKLVLTRRPFVLAALLGGLTIGGSRYWDDSPRCSYKCLFYYYETTPLSRTGTVSEL